VGSAAGVPDEKLSSLADHATSPLFDERERTALAYADAITRTGDEVSDELFERIRSHFDEDQIVELTAVIAWENASSKFNHALGVPSQHLQRRSGHRPD
jgi:alkylhydroperoxidase family enzyme